MNRLTVTRKEQNGLHYLTLQGEFDQYEGERDIRLLNDAYSEILAKGQSDLVLRFETGRIGTVGINTLTEIYEVVTENKGRLRFVNFPEAEMKYLEITGFIQFVDLVARMDQLESRSG